MEVVKLKKALAVLEQSPANPSASPARSTGSESDMRPSKFRKVLPTVNSPILIKSQESNEEYGMMNDSQVPDLMDTQLDSFPPGFSASSGMDCILHFDRWVVFYTTYKR